MTVITSHYHKSPSIVDYILHPVRQFLDDIDVRDRQFAQLVCRLIPSQCPFARDIKVFGKTVLHIPPLCKINPLYDQLMSLRFRALSYLADRCGEDITIYCV
ncbi:Mo-dependent nitrogenase C-terminal domain-containing protein [Aerosakkonemataceae cyanobacterium BLCC-F50]|uniref:Mo-dependent nitrogenase C-terminal domain-containing protein n=1 Tax=Floridaenema flaviceps BLCC-F50 TaxID=3153642 RepID=A0ABV4Y1A7_9CYAN